MKQIFPVCVIIFAAGFYLLNFTFAEKIFDGGAKKMSVPLTDEQQLKNLYNEMWQALQLRDMETLEKIHDPDFVLVPMTGMKQSKAEYLRCVREGELKYFSAQPENIFVELNGLRGILTGQSKVEASVFGGSKNTWRLQLKFEVEKISGRWILKSGVASTY